MTDSELLFRVFVLANAETGGGRSISIDRSGQWENGIWTYTTWRVGIPRADLKIFLGEDDRNVMLFPQAKGNTLSEALQNLIKILERRTRNTVAHMVGALNDEPWKGDPEPDPNLQYDWKE